jgi:hypothetical protein
MNRFFAVTLGQLLVVFPIWAAIVGCGQQRVREASRAPASAAETRGMINDASASVPRVKQQARFVAFQAAPAVPRKIIYEAGITLVVEDIAKTETEIDRLLKEFDSYVSEANVDRTQGEQLSGKWQVRIPVANFESFLDALSKLGVAESRRQTAQDVTEEFVDLEAQISNKKRLEERIVELLKDKSGAIKDVIEVERELGRVRGEIEQMEGRLRYLTNRTELTTITITAREERNYVPPAAPTFTNQIASAWWNSLTALRSFGERLVIVIVVLFPWFVLLCVLIVPAFWYFNRRNAATKQVTATERRVDPV